MIGFILRLMSTSSLRKNITYVSKYYTQKTIHISGRLVYILVLFRVMLNWR